MNKLAGLLDPVKDTLPPGVWGPDKQLLPTIRSRIISDVTGRLDYSKIKYIFILGSITGYKYSDKSDIDVNVVIDGELPPEKAKSKLFSDINGNPAKGTTHPINYFVQEYYEGMRKNLQDVEFGIYSVLEDTWVSIPPDRSTVKDPAIEFRSEVVIAKMIANEFDRIMDRYLKQKDKVNNDPLCSKRDKDLLARFRKEAVEFANNIEDERKLSYYHGWGIPRNSYQNIVFKYVEYGKYGDLFEKYMKEDTAKETFMDYLDDYILKPKEKKAFKLDPLNAALRKKLRKSPTTFATNVSKDPIKKVTQEIKNLNPESWAKKKKELSMIDKTTEINAETFKIK